MFGNIESLSFYIPSEEELNTGKEIGNGDHVFKTWPNHRGNRLTQINDKLYFLAGIGFTFDEQDERYSLIEEDKPITPIKEFKTLYPDISITFSCLVNLHIEAELKTGESRIDSHVSKSGIAFRDKEGCYICSIYDLENDLTEEYRKAKVIFQRFFSIQTLGVTLNLSKGGEFITDPQPKMFFTPPEGSIQKVVCSATYLKSGRIIPGVRHFGRLMRHLIQDLGDDTVDAEQGFLDQFENFLTREEAWVVANNANQIVKRVGGDEGKLFSENLY